MRHANSNKKERVFLALPAIGFIGAVVPCAWGEWLPQSTGICREQYARLDAACRAPAAESAGGACVAFRGPRAAAAAAGGHRSDSAERTAATLRSVHPGSAGGAFPATCFDAAPACPVGRTANHGRGRGVTHFRGIPRDHLRLDGISIAIVRPHP